MRSFPLPSPRLVMAATILASIGCSTAFDDSLSDNVGASGNGGTASQQAGAAGRPLAGAAGAPAGSGGAPTKGGAAGTSAGGSGGANTAGASGATGGNAGAASGNGGAAASTGGAAGGNGGAAGGNGGAAGGSGGAGGLGAGASGSAGNGGTAGGSAGASGAPTCTSGAAITCVGRDRVRCVDGKVEIIETCGAGSCDPAGCLECVQGQKACDGSTITTCQNGKLTPSQECAPLACAAGACVPECSGVQQRCQGKALQQCVGGVFTTIQQCGPTETCDASANTCRICTEGATRCTGLTAEACTEGKWVNDEICATACWGSVGCLTTLGAMAAGQGRTCVLAGASSNGRPYCWGDSSHGELGLLSARVSPRFIADTPSAKAIAMGRAHTCIVTTGNEVRCAGANNHGQLGRGNVDAEASTAFAVVTPLASSPTISQIVAGDDITCIRRSTGVVECWGQFADGSSHPAPVKLTNGGVTTFAAGRGSLGLQSPTNTGAGATEPMRAFGANVSGQLGNGKSSPTAIVGLPGDQATAVRGVKFYAAGGEHTAADTPIGHGCAVDNANDLYCWGLNDAGQAGPGAPMVDVTIDGTPRKVVLNPTKLFGGAAQISAGRTHTCAIRNDTQAGAVWCFGENVDGRTGEPVEATSTPRPVSLVGPALALAVGDDHSCAIVSKQTVPATKEVYCWGANDKGQLGDGGGNSATPRLVVLSGN